MEKQDPSHGGLVKGYFYSIIFMMATPYLVLGSFCAVMYYRVRRAPSGRQAQATARRCRDDHQPNDGSHASASDRNRRKREPIEV